MSLKSMTGYGCGSAASGGIAVEAEVSSVNRKQFDLRLNMPRGLAALEPEVVKLVRKRVSRGSVNCKITVALSGRARAGAVRVDRVAAAAAVKALRDAGAELGLRDDLDVSLLLKLPDVVAFDNAAADTGKVRPVLKKAVQAALEGLTAMRAAEGSALEKDLTRRFAALEKRVERIAKLAPGTVAAYRKLLHARLRDAGLEIDADDERVAKEIALFADRCDISEEITRLRSHFAQFSQLVQSKEPVGRSFDFLCQELLREINTIGSKANDARISRQVIAFKAELEAVREQVQNIE